MPSLTQSTVAAPAAQVTVSPVLKHALLREFRAYQKLAKEKAAVEKKLDEKKALIQALREETGEKSINFDGFTTTLCDGGTTKKFNRVRALASGMTEAQIEALFDETPKKAYELVTVPR